MANYGLLVQDNGDGSFQILALNRGTTTTTFSGGTDLTTNTFTVTPSTGLLATASGFAVTTNMATSAQMTLGRKAKLNEVMVKASEICSNDLSFNGF